MKRACIFILTIIINFAFMFPKVEAKSNISSTDNNGKSSKSVEKLDWWKSARYVFPIGAIAEVTDVGTGKTFRIKRTMGSNHADCEALTRRDTDIIRSIWGDLTGT
jgi:hypothetical protein